jgi:acyl-CoA thioesterase I
MEHRQEPEEVEGASKAPERTRRDLAYDTSLVEARRNLEGMMDRLAAALPACEGVAMVMNPPTSEYLAVRPRIEAYNQAYRQVARERGLRLIDHWPAWQRLLCEDPDAFRL